MTNIHILKQDNKYTIFNPESLSLFSVSETIGKMLESYKSGSDRLPENLGCNDPYIAKLLDCFDESVNCNTCRGKSYGQKDPKALCLIISHDCNLRCGYCFADHGSFGGEKKLMDVETARKAMDKLLSKSSSNFISFYGGEPFLNFDLMKDAVEYGGQNNLDIKYTTITNGTIMNADIKEFVHTNLFALQFSLDGPKEINDIQRFGSVESVHDRVVESLGLLKTGAYPLSIKCILTKKSVNNLNAIIEHLSSLGVGSIAFAEASLLSEDSELHMSDSEYERCITELSQILVRNLDQLASGDDVPVLGPIFDILRSLTTMTRKINCCSAGREYLAVTADGDVYPCHGFVGIDDFKMGNVRDEDFPEATYYTIRNIFNDLNVDTSNECSSCWARYLCGGGCEFYSYV
ncbi:MAG TPA: SPASM domain-containing protein [Methanotrichaceae archaeon]|nr:SPASM domain-containing protein [Methanotrichaceae archaeon]HQF17574.1 SPASM domain-containing protein [Methanotrichaceae archaeon]HQI92132.1 SPASM domain-containing protein [Methanotrichaceae archaeon]